MCKLNTPPLPPQHATQQTLYKYIGTTREQRSLKHYVVYRTWHVKRLFNPKFLCNCMVTLWVCSHSNGIARQYHSTTVLPFHWTRTKARFKRHCNLSDGMRKANVIFYYLVEAISFHNVCTVARGELECQRSRHTLPYTGSSQEHGLLPAALSL